MFSVGSNYARSDIVSVLFYPPAMVGVFSLLGEILLWSGTLNGWYSSGYVVLVALCANRICLRSGLLCAVLAVMVHVYVFVHPRWLFVMPPLEQVVAYASMIAAAVLLARRAPSNIEINDGLARGSTLPFIDKSPSSSANGRYWHVPEGTGDWQEDSQLGSEYGRIYVEQWASKGTGPLFPWIVRDMVRSGRWSGIEAGFTGVVGRLALRRINRDLSPERERDVVSYNAAVSARIRLHHNADDLR